MPSFCTLLSTYALYSWFAATQGPASAQPYHERVLDEASFKAAPQLSLSSRSKVLDDQGGRTFDNSYVRSATFLEDGSVAALSSIGTYNLLAHFDNSGKLIRVLGGIVGSGPGDFRRPTGVVARGRDTVLVADPGNNRVNRIFIASGRVETLPVDYPSFIKHSLIVGVLPKNRIVLTEKWTLPTRLRGNPTHTERTIVVGVLGAQFRQVAKITDLRVTQMQTRFRRLDTMTVVKRLAPQAMIAVWDTMLVSSSGDPAEISLRNPNGKIVSVLRFTIPRRPVTQLMREFDLRQRLAQLEGNLAEPLINKSETQRIETAKPFADLLPVFESLFVTPDKLLWVLLTIAPTDKDWTAIAIRKDGSIAGRLMGSSTARPLAFSRTHVLLISQQSDGLATLEVRGIEGWRDNR